MTFYQDYRWENGRPVGLGKTSAPNTLLYKIISDPYLKRFSVEEYQHGKFHCCLYDSALINFRRLTPQDQTAWQNELLDDSGQTKTSIIRDQDDRVVIIESYTFEKERCRQCTIRSVHQVKLAEQYILYKDMGDRINGVLLVDLLGKPVMVKEYQVDKESGEFTELIKENWAIKPEETQLWQISTSKITS